MNKSYLEFGYDVQDLLFKGLTVNSVGGMVGLCFIVALFTFTYEGVKTLRQRVASATRNLKKGAGSSSGYDSDRHSERSMLVEMDSSCHSGSWRKMKGQLLLSVLYMVQVTMGYVLMLIIMSYNAWLAVTIFASAGLSYYFFSSFVLHRPSVIPIEILTPENCSH